MKTYKVIHKINKGNCFCNNTVINFKFREIKRVLVKGIVKNPQGIPLANIGIEVIKLDKINNLCINLGVVFTDCNGEYGVSLEVNECYSYKFNAYSSV